MSRVVVVHDLMQDDYSYECVESVGKHFDPEFTPDLTPKQCLKLGIFGGKYMTDCRAEFPADWMSFRKIGTKVLRYVMSDMILS